MRALRPCEILAKEETLVSFPQTLERRGARQNNMRRK